MLYPAVLRARKAGHGVYFILVNPLSEPVPRPCHPADDLKMVLQAGIEPARLYRQKILSLLCLPIPPPEHDMF